MNIEYRDASAFSKQDLLTLNPVYLCQIQVKNNNTDDKVINNEAVTQNHRHSS
jgi:hypothetical protein